MAKNTKSDDYLADLLSAASQGVLVDLVLQLANARPDVRGECLEYLKEHVRPSAEQRQTAAGEAVLALWWEVEHDLDELDQYGGGDYEVQDSVSSLLYEIKTNLADKQVDPDHRAELLELVLPYIESGNAGMDHELYEVAYAACYDRNDLRTLAEAFEAMGGEWQADHARRIYRKLGDRTKYLELRLRKMIYGGDYYDLATFYWDAGEKEKALQVAEEGLNKGQGRMDELRGFLAQRAKDSGNREAYLDLEFAQATNHLTLEKYKNFKKICTDAEWGLFEGRVVESLKKAWETDQLKIRMYRGEHEEALAILTRRQYPVTSWEGDYEIQAAKELESRFPEPILKYYLSGLGNLKTKATRKEYGRKATLMAKVRRVLVEILKDEKRWLALAGQVKRDNIGRPAFQEEFALEVPGWLELS
jgi:hypothetical protein